MQTKPLLLGSISNPYSNLLTVVIADANHANSYGGIPDEESQDIKSDFQSVIDAKKSGVHEISLGDAKALICEIGGCGSSDIYQVAENALVFLEHYSDDWDDIIEDNFLRTLAEYPTTENIKMLGTVRITSGCLAIIESGQDVKIGPEQIENVLSHQKAAEFEDTLLIPLQNGTYELWEENLNELEGEWGTIVTRFRLVLEGTSVTPGAPIAKVEPKKTATPLQKILPSRNFVTTGWDAIQSFAISRDGTLVFAGEKGGFRVCCWRFSTGELLWERELEHSKASGKFARYSQAVTVVAGPAQTLLAHAFYTPNLFSLAESTGNPVAANRKILSLQSFALSPDDQEIMLRVSMSLKILSYPSFELLNEYSNMNLIAISPDGAWLVVRDLEMHIYDLKRRVHHKSFKVDDISHGAFSVDSKTLALARRDGQVLFYKTDSWTWVNTLDTAPERNRKPALRSLAYSRKGILGTASDDGAVKLWDESLNLITTLEKMNTTIPDTGSRTIAQVSFVDDHFIVSASSQNKPVGLTVVSLSSL